MEESFLVCFTEATLVIAPKTYPSLKVVQVIVARDKSHEASQLESCKTVDIFGFNWIGRVIEVLAMLGGRVLKPLLVPGVQDGFLDIVFEFDWRFVDADC